MFLEILLWRRFCFSPNLCYFQLASLWGSDLRDCFSKLILVIIFSSQSWESLGFYNLRLDDPGQGNSGTSPPWEHTQCTLPSMIKFGFNTPRVKIRTHSQGFANPRRKYCGGGDRLAKLLETSLVGKAPNWA